MNDLSKPMQVMHYGKWIDVVCTATRCGRNVLVEWKEGGQWNFYMPPANIVLTCTDQFRNAPEREVLGVSNVYRHFVSGMHSTRKHADAGCTGTSSRTHVLTIWREGDDVFTELEKVTS